MKTFLQKDDLLTGLLISKRIVVHKDQVLSSNELLNILISIFIFAMSFGLSKQTWADPNTKPKDGISQQESQSKLSTTQKSAKSEAVCVKQINPQLKKNQTILNVTGMVCAFCVQGIEIQLKKLTGVENVDVDLDKGKVVLNLNQSTPPHTEDLCEAIKRAGYTVTTVESSS